MQDIEIIIDRGYGEKKLIISEKFITADQNQKDSLFNLYNPDVLIFMANGDFEPPFIKGSPILRELRSTSGLQLENWKILLPLYDDNSNFLKLFTLENNFKSDKRKDWGIWINDEAFNNSPRMPILLVLNYPLYILKEKWGKNNDLEWLSEKLSLTYRITLSAVDIIKSFYPNLIKTIHLADLGGSLLNGKKNNNLLIHSTRIKIFSQVICNWLSNTIDPSKVIVSFGKGMNTKLLENVWGEQAEINKDNESEFGEALKLRTDNAELCKRLINLTNSKNELSKFRSLLSEASIAFSSNSLTLATDLIQTRALTEALASELTKHFGVKSESANLIAYTERLEKSNKVSPWITSYFHVLRLLGNEAAHYKSESKRRPEKPVGKDLIVIHATLNRVLNFFIDEFENK